MTEIQEHAQKALDSLAKSVREALEKKRLLGQYAVISKNGKVVKIYGDDLRVRPEKDTQ